MSINTIIINGTTLNLDAEREAFRDMKDLIGVCAAYSVVRQSVKAVQQSDNMF